MIAGGITTNFYAKLSFFVYESIIITEVPNVFYLQTIFCSERTKKKQHLFTIHATHSSILHMDAYKHNKHVHKVNTITLIIT